MCNQCLWKFVELRNSICSEYQSDSLETFFRNYTYVRILEFLTKIVPGNSNGCVKLFLACPMKFWSEMVNSHVNEIYKNI